MSYQLSIILGTTISLRKFRRPLFGRYLSGSPFCFPRDGDLPLLQRGKRSEKGKARRASESVRIAPSIIFTREGARRRREAGKVCLFVRISFPRMPLGHLHRQRRRYDSPEGARGRRLRRRGRGSSEEKSYYRYYSNSVRVDAMLKRDKEKARESERERARRANSSYRE